MDNTVHTTSHGTQRDVTVHEAATALGLSPEAVRARLRRGTLDGSKGDDGTWRVHLPEEATVIDVTGGSHLPPVANATPVPDVTPPLRDGTHHDTQHGTQRDVTDDALVTHLQEEVVYLRERLEDAMGHLAEERRRADVLRLGAPVSTPDEPPIETYRASTQTPPEDILARLRRWLTGNG